ncbi:MAG: calcium/sodium antiporter [Candidatus Nanoarchaeia archaeon]
MLEYILFIIGIFFLVKGADYLVSGSSSLAKKLKVPSLVIGLTIVAFGTSLPELVVNIISAIKGNGDIAFGNIVGSNIANILLILGISSIITHLKVQKSTTWKEIPFSLLAAFCLFVFAGVPLFDSLELNSIYRFEGIIFLLFFLIFLYYVFELARKNKKEMSDQKLEIKSMSYSKILVYILGGLVLLYFGGKWTVEGAIQLARLFGMSEYFISLTIVAVGTSLPELVTSIIAAVRKDADIAVGNVVGSNIFNIFLILGITTLIIPISIPLFAIIDLIFLLAITLLLFVFMFIGKKHEIDKWQGVLFLVLYALYIIHLIKRG